MMLLNEASKVYFGANAAATVYRGSSLVWQPPATGAWGPEEGIYLPSATPVTAGVDAQTFSVGNNIRILVDGRITGIRHWRASNSSVTSHSVDIWTDAGASLAHGMTTGDVVGWNTFAITPIDVKAGDLIRVVHAHYGSGVGDSWPYTDTAHTSASPHLQWVQGVFGLPVDSFPNQTTGGYNYFVDVVFQEKLASYPAVLNSAAAWIDATQDSFADGAAITSYTSHSTSGRVFTGSGTLNYRASIDGKPRLDFNTGWLKSASYTPPSTGFTFVIVKRITGVSPSSGIGMPMVYNEDAYNNYEMRLSSFLQIQMVYEYNNGAPAVTSDVVVTTARDYLIWCEWNTITNAPVRMFINNVLHGEGTFTPAGITAPTAALIIGTRGYAGDFPEIMQVGEAVVFNGVLSDAARTEVANYLIAKWSISLAARDAPTALPALPPFVNGAPPP